MRQRMRRFVRWATVASCLAAAACGGGAGDRRARETRSAASASTGPAHLVADLRTGGAANGSTPHGFVPVSPTRAFFVADDGASGNELWVTDLGGGGTAPVLDLRPGSASALPAPGVRFEAIPFGGGLLFAADDGARGSELWFSDGTATGTRLVKDLSPGTAPSSPRAFAAAGATVYFVATTGPVGATQVELWSTDGTAAHTALVAPIGLGETDPTELVVSGGVIYFGGRTSGGPGLWTSVPGGATGEVKALGSVPTGLTAFLGRVWFAAAPFAASEAVLWSTNGTPSGTVAAPNPFSVTEPSLLTVVGTRLYYAGTAAAMRDLFSTTGADQNQHTFSGVDPGAMATAGGKLFLTAVVAADGVGRELYAWNPFAGAIQLLADATPGAASSSPSSLTPFGTRLLFGAADGSSAAPALWQSDGTAAGTSRVFARGGPEVGEMVSLGTLALLAGTDGAGSEPWTTDGTASGTSALANLQPDLAGALPDGLVGWQDRVFFAADGEDGGTPVGRELWTSTGAGATLVANIALDGAATASSGPADLVATGGGILFTASDAIAGRELWATDGTTLATALLKDVDPSVVSVNAIPVPRSGLQSPAWLTALGPVVLFAADGGAAAGGVGRELWATDGTSAGTRLLSDLNVGAASSFPTGLTAAGGAVWFSADDGDPLLLSRIYRSDGTTAGTVAAPQLDCTAGPVYSPRWFAELNGEAMFAAESDYFPGAVKLFRYDATSGCVRHVIDTTFYDTVDPVSFTSTLGAGWFGARDPWGWALWTTDGRPTGTRPVVRFGSQGGGAIGAVAALGGRLFVIANDEVHGDELWTFDPATETTALVKDALPGPLGASEGSAIVPLPARGRILYAADDGVAGRELWISDGTTAGTRLLQDLRPGPASSNPERLTKVGDLVYFTADDGASGRELWVLDTSDAGLDLTPPTPACPAAPMVFEATRPEGADPVYAISASDDRPGPIAISYDPPSGSPVLFGDARGVTATAVDGTGNSASCTFVVRVLDSLAPALTCPGGAGGEVRAEATGASGAAVSFDATAVDTVDVSPTVTYSVAPGSVFPLGAGDQPGVTAVAVTATDDVPNVSTCTFQVVVADTTPPVPTCPAPDPVEATTFAGAAVTWVDAGVTDAVSPVGSIVVTYDATRGDLFPFGTTTVHVNATDRAGNVGTCSFPVTVRDTTRPDISCPPAGPFEATGPAGATASFAAIASDAATPGVTIVYSAVDGGHPSGEVVTAALPLGTHFVVATASDGRTQPSSCQFALTVRDTTPPAMSCPALPVAVEAAGPAGAIVPLDGLASATDLVSLATSVAYAPTSGALFPLQASTLPTTTTVTATSPDAAGNVGTCTFDVVVRDTTPPAASHPCDAGYALATEATGPGGALVPGPRDFHDAVTADGALAFAYADQATGAPLAASWVQPLGSIVVAVVATDRAGNTSGACTHSSVVRDTRPPVAACPANVTVEALGPAGADASWLDATGVDSVTAPGALLVSYDQANGGVFPVGDTTVIATVRDAAANAGQCGFLVHVVDTTPPVVACPASVAPVEATAGGGAPVTFEVTAADSVTAVPLVSYDHQPGDPFPVGTTVVTATATDDAGNASAPCQLSVVVVDTTPPLLVCPADRTAQGNGSVAVQFPAPDVSDAGTPIPTVTSTHQSGELFPQGSTVVRFTATDASGNAASCAMTVTVVPAPPGGGGGGCSTGSGGAVALLGLVAAVLRRRRP